VQLLFRRLFCEGAATFSPNQGFGNGAGGYSNQLLMFDASYRASVPQIKGHSPCAALQFQLEPFAHFTVETAYWMRDTKTKALHAAALK
jgi:hypothetical protein